MNSPTLHEVRRKDRAWSPYRRALGPLVGIVEEARRNAESLEDYLGQRKRARRPSDQETFRLTVEALVSDVAHRVLSQGSDARVHLSLRNDDLKSSRRYRPASVGTALKQALTLLARCEVGNWLRVYPPRVPGERTSVAAGPRLLQRIREHRVELQHVISKFDTEEVVLLRDVKDREPVDLWSADRPGRLIDYRDSDETYRLRNEVRVINEGLHRLRVERVSPDGRQALDMPSVFLRRVFTNGSFGTGGRLWDANGSAEWYPMPSGVRLNSLYINGERVAAVDIKSASIAILYAMAEKALPCGDLYTPPGYGPEHRATFKLAAQCAAFRRKAYREWPRDVCNLRPERRPILAAAEAFAALEDYHSPISHLYWQGAGHRTQRLESDIMVRTLVTRPELCGLPVHDALYVPERRAEDAAQALKESFQAVTGGVCQVSIDYATDAGR